MNLKSNLKLLRKACGFNQEDVAKALNIDRSAYSYYETGKTEPSVRNLVKIARMFRVSIDELVGNSEYSAQLEFGNEPDENYDIGLHTDLSQLSSCNPQERTLIAYFRVIDDKEKVMKLIEDEFERQQAAEDED